MTPEEAKNYDKCRLKENDLIIVRSGVNTGDCTRITKEFSNAYAAYDLILDLKSSVNPEYMNVFLNLDLGKSQIQRVKARSAQPHLNANEVKSLKIPLPPREIQDKIASIMHEAYATKKKKESETDCLLNSIEPYTLELLGIKIQEVEEKSPKVFSVEAELLTGGRLDPFYYTPRFVEMEKALDKCRYQLKTFGNILSSPIVNGLDARKFVEVGTKYLRVGDIKPDEIDETDIKFVNIPIENIKKDMKLEFGDVLLTRKGTFGISAVVRDTTDYIISSEIMRLRLKKEVNPFYFSIINNTRVIQEQYRQKAVGAIMGSLSQGVLKTVKIPIPPADIQETIVKEVQKRREKAKKLKEEAKELLEKAKKEVEEFIEKRQQN